MNGPTKNEWTSPSAIIGAVGMLAALGAFWVSFDRRVSITETNVEIVSQAIRDHKVEEGERYKRIDDKLDRLLERQLTSSHGLKAGDFFNKRATFRPDT